MFSMDVVTFVCSQYKEEAVDEKGDKKKKDKAEEAANSKYTKKEGGIPKFFNSKKEGQSQATQPGTKTEDKTTAKPAEKPTTSADTKRDNKPETKEDKLLSLEKSQSDRKETPKVEVERTKSENVKDQATPATGKDEKQIAQDDAKLEEAKKASVS